MGANEQLALDANLSGWKSTRASGLPPETNPFEYYCIERFLQDWIDSDEELQTGMIGGSKDGGVDGFYFFVNRELVREDVITDAKTAMNADLLIFQIKEGEGFSPLAVDKLYFFTEDLMDLTKQESNYHQQYRPHLLRLMRLFKDTFRGILGEGMPDFSVNYFYVTKKDVEHNGDCTASETKLQSKVAELFPKAKFNFRYVNATELYNQVQARPKKKRKLLKWAAQPSETPEGFLGLVHLTEYFKFLKDDTGQLNKRIFESNVRGYWQKTSVNSEILKTLAKSQEATEFWLLNNGITMLVADLDGTTEMWLTDPQIVNGLQTSRLIYSYYHGTINLPSNDNRRILIRVIKPKSEAVRDEVIRATNRQNQMPIESLRATDEIHRQIEEHFLKFGLFYDRRKGHYRDEGKPITKIVSIVELLQAMLSCVLRRPNDARGRPRNYFGDDKNYPYEDVFGDGKHNLNVYLKSLEILRRVEKFLDDIESEPIHRRNLKFYVCMYVACVATKSTYVPPGDFMNLDVAALPDKTITDSYNRVRKAYDALAEKSKIDGEYDYDSVAKGTKLPAILASKLKSRLHPKKSSQL